MNRKVTAMMVDDWIAEHMNTELEKYDVEIYVEHEMTGKWSMTFAEFKKILKNFPTGKFVVTTIN